LVWRLWRTTDAAGVWQTICDEALLPYLLVHRHANRNPVNLGVFALSAIAAITALAGPAWERLPTPVFRDESALVLLLDMSRSMDATDISPSRLERAKYKLTDILRQRREGQTALVVYAAEPYVVTPLTNDVATIEAQLPALRTGIMPSQGSAGGSAVAKGIELLRQAGMASGELLLVTDGLQLAELDRAKKLIANSNARLSVFGVGTSEGAPIPDRSGGFITDAGGNIVVEPLRSSPLQELARVGRGIYQSIRNDDQDVEVFLRLWANNLHQRNARTTDLFAERWREFGPWLLLGLIPFAPLAFRRGVLMVVVTAGLAATVFPHTADADWWVTADQAARRRFEQGDFAGAAQTFNDQRWRATAHYRAGNYAAAAAVTAPDAGAESNYNKGNALARMGQYDDAIAAYDQALIAVPDHADALHNKALLEALQTQAEEQPQQPAQRSDPAAAGERQDQGADGTGDASDGDVGGDAGDSDSLESPEPSEAQGDQSKASTSSEGPSDQQADSAEPALEANEEQANDEEREAELAADAQANAELENEQATEQWLRQIPDDPGGLLRRKFEYEYQKKYARGIRRSQAW